ncbi:Uncharacterised protein [Vibrio cholerae]|nr:Uncharacterised protein [Vibrio cholerae]CSI46168.1 Uncharacterised protein [Vibrio cholerae]
MSSYVTPTNRSLLRVCVLKICCRSRLSWIKSVTGRWKLGVERRLMLASVSLAKIHGNVYAL